MALGCHDKKSSLSGVFCYNYVLIQEAVRLLRDRRHDTFWRDCILDNYRQRIRLLDEKLLSYGSIIYDYEDRVNILDRLYLRARAMEDDQGFIARRKKETIDRIIHEKDVSDKYCEGPRTKERDKGQNQKKMVKLSCKMLPDLPTPAEFIHNDKHKEIVITTRPSHREEDQINVDLPEANLIENTELQRENELLNVPDEEKDVINRSDSEDNRKQTDARVILLGKVGIGNSSSGNSFLSGNGLLNKSCLGKRHRDIDDDFSVTNKQITEERNTDYNYLPTVTDNNQHDIKRRKVTSTRPRNMEEDVESVELPEAHLIKKRELQPENELLLNIPNDTTDVIQSPESDLEPIEIESRYTGLCHQSEKLTMKSDADDLSTPAEFNLHGKIRSLISTKLYYVLEKVDIKYKFTRMIQKLTSHAISSLSLEVEMSPTYDQFTHKRNVNNGQSRKPTSSIFLFGTSLLLMLACASGTGMNECSKGRYSERFCLIDSGDSFGPQLLQLEMMYQNILHPWGKFNTFVTSCDKIFSCDRNVTENDVNNMCYPSDNLDLKSYVEDGNSSIRIVDTHDEKIQIQFIHFDGNVLDIFADQNDEEMDTFPGSLISNIKGKFRKQTEIFHETQDYLDTLNETKNDDTNKEGIFILLEYSEIIICTCVVVDICLIVSLRKRSVTTYNQMSKNLEKQSGKKRTVLLISSTTTLVLIFVLKYEKSWMKLHAGEVITSTLINTGMIPVMIVLSKCHVKLKDASCCSGTGKTIYSDCISQLCKLPKICCKDARMVTEEMNSTSDEGKIVCKSDDYFNKMITTQKVGDSHQLSDDLRWMKKREVSPETVSSYKTVGNGGGRKYSEISTGTTVSGCLIVFLVTFVLYRHPLFLIIFGHNIDDVNDQMVSKDLDDLDKLDNTNEHEDTDNDVNRMDGTEIDSKDDLDNHTDMNENSEENSDCKNSIEDDETEVEDDDVHGYVSGRLKGGGDNLNINKPEIKEVALASSTVNMIHLDYNKRDSGFYDDDNTYFYSVKENEVRSVNLENEVDDLNSDDNVDEKNGMVTNGLNVYVNGLTVSNVIENADTDLEVCGMKKYNIDADYVIGSDETDESRDNDYAKRSIISKPDPYKIEYDGERDMYSLRRTMKIEAGIVWFLYDLYYGTQNLLYKNLLRGSAFADIEANGEIIYSEHDECQVHVPEVSLKRNKQRKFLVMESMESYSIMTGPDADMTVNNFKDRSLSDIDIDDFAVDSDPLKWNPRICPLESNQNAVGGRVSDQRPQEEHFTSLTTGTAFLSKQKAGDKLQIELYTSTELSSLVTQYFEENPTNTTNTNMSVLDDMVTEGTTCNTSSKMDNHGNRDKLRDDFVRYNPMRDSVLYMAEIRSRSNLIDLPTPKIDVSYLNGLVYRIDEPLLSVIGRLAGPNPPTPHISMRYELLRFCTLRTYPRGDKPYLIKLAKAGFYYASDGDGVVCYCCGIRRYNWTGNEDPMTVHMGIKPNCKFLVKNEDNNVPVVYNGPWSRSLMAIDNIPMSQHQRSEEHVVQNTLQSAQESPATQQNLGINESAPKSPNYVRKEKRLESYKDWPRDAKLSPEVLATAGFYHAGFGDCVRCFYCGIGLRHWSAEDDPWVEHARWARTCVFVRQKKGVEFVNLVQMAVQFTQDNTSTMAGDTNNGLPVTILEKLLLSKGALQAAEMGFNTELIRQAVDELIRDGVKDCVPAEQLLDIIERIDAENKRAASKGATSEEVKGSSVESKSGSGEFSENPSGATASKSSNPNTSKSQNAQKGETDPVQDPQTIKNENEKLKEQTLCKVCLDNTVSIVFLPCGHLVTCPDCAPAMRKCPICRALVKGTVRTYMS